MGKVKYQGTEYTLLSFWEEFLPKQLRFHSKDASTWQREYEAQSPAWWDQMPAELFRTWGREAAAVACNQIYDKVSSAKDGESFEISEELFGEWLKLSDHLTSQAGSRLAFIL